MTIHSVQSIQNLEDERELDSRSDCDSASISSPSNAANSPSASNLPTSVKSPKVVFYLIGLLLTATALAKLWMLVTDSFADVRVGIPKEILWLSVAFELWLAFENFRIRDHRLLAFINTLVFGAFAIFGSIRWMLGYGSCGCSGNLELPSWIFILLDVGIIISFNATSELRLRKADGWQELSSWWRGCSADYRGRIGGLVLFAISFLALQLPMAAPLRAIAYGEPPITASVKLDERLMLDQPTFGQALILNHSTKPVKIIGISRSCRCFELTEDPISRSIPAKGRLVVSLVIKPNKLGPLRQRVELFLDHPKQFRVKIDVAFFVQGEK